MELKNKMKKNRRLMIGLAVLLNLAVISPCRTGMALAAKNKADGTDFFKMDYLYPFDLTITSCSLTSTEAIVVSGATTQEEVNTVTVPTMAMATPAATPVATPAAAPVAVAIIAPYYLKPPMV